MRLNNIKQKNKQNITKGGAIPMEFLKGKRLMCLTSLLFISVGTIPVLILYFTDSLILATMIMLLMIYISLTNINHIKKDLNILIAETNNIAKGNLIIKETNLRSIKEIKSLSVNFNDMARLLGQIMDELQNRSNELEDRNINLEKVATTDPLTQVHNRHYLMSAIPNIHQLLLKKKIKTLSAIFLDIDFFKNFNTIYGHDGGDKALKHVARILDTTIRQGDILSRVGGEEFVVLLPNCNIENAKALAERLRENVEKQSIDMGGENVSVNISLGVAEYSPGETLHDLIFIRADQKLLFAKENGRNRVEY